MTIEKLKSLEPIFGAWYVDSKLAEGRNSKVFKVYKTVNGVTELLALKTVKFPAGDKELSRVIESGKYKTVGEYLDTLEKAVTDNMNKMLSLRTNTNIVRFDNFQIVKESSCFYVVMLMELLSPFSEKVRPDDVTAEQAIKIGCDLCSAAEGFRNIGIIHHQIKPENIYVDSEGNFKLGDFGISNIAGRVRTEASPYMAPEVYRESAYDTSSDIYSIGVLLYKLLNNNRLPFLPEYPLPVSLSERETAFERQMCGDNLAAPSKADSEMAKIISKALAYVQSDRYFSPLLMKTELERYAESISEKETLPASDYPEALQPPVYVPLTSVPPMSGFRLADGFGDEETNDDEDSIYFNPSSAVSEAEKTAFRETFKENVETDTDDDGKDNKKIYLLVAAVIAVLAIAIGLIFFSGDSGASENTTSAPHSSHTVATTQPSTVAPTVPPTLSTTEPSTAETTTELTTEETTTETTTEETTTETTTEETTAETTAPISTDMPELVTSGFSDGDESSDGRIYRAIEDYTLIQTPENEFFDEVMLEISTPLGENITTQGNVHIYEMAGSSIIQKITANLEITLDESEGEQIINCHITVDDGDFYYSPEYYQYYICFDEGTLISDDIISLPLQLQI
ncbi:MAG: protein kinase [Clostridia bacterium]|nr:protein kinase [Clostridia bacterium]